MTFEPDMPPELDAHGLIEFRDPETGETINAYIIEKHFCGGEFIGYVANDIRDASKLYGGLFQNADGTWEMKPLRIL
jgi:hypothetical protein